MRKIFIGAGHSNVKGKDRGAEGNGYIEGELAVELRDLLVQELKKLGITPIIDSNSNILSETILKFKNILSTDCIVLDIHWNAGPVLAKGVETLIPANSTNFERKLAEGLSSIVSSILKTPMRGKNGVKTEAESHHGRLGWMRLTGENVLLETCFITNKTEMDSYQKNKNIIAQNVAKLLVEFAKDNINTYVIVKGDTLTSISKHTGNTIPELVSLNNLSKDSKIFIGQVLKLK